MLVMVITLLGAALMQTLMPAYAFLGQARFPFLLAVVLYYALNHDAAVMLTAAFLAGLLQDTLGQTPLGYTAFCFCVAGWITSRFSRTVLIESLVTPAFFGGVAAVIVTVVTSVLLLSRGAVSFSPGWLLLKTLGSGFLGMICTPAVFLMVRTLDVHVGNIEVREEVDDTFTGSI